MARTEWTPRGKGQISSSPLPSGKAPPGPPAPAWQEPRCHKRRRGRSAFFESMGPRRKGPVTSLAMAAAMRGRRRQSLAGMDPGQAEANGCPMTAVSVRSDRAPLEREETRGPANSRGRVTPLEGRGERGGGARAPHGERCGHPRKGREGRAPDAPHANGAPVPTVGLRDLAVLLARVGTLSGG